MRKTIYRVFLFILIFSPIAFGTVEQWSLTVMETASILALFLLLIRKVRDRESPFYEVPGTIPLLLLLAYMIFQLLPLPPGMIKMISPATHALYGKSVLMDGGEGWISLSLNRKATLLEFFRLVSYAAFYVLTVQVMTKKDLMKNTINVVIVFASVLSFFAILQHVFSNNRIFWVRDLTQGGMPFGPYVNRNHYAGLMEMVFPLVLGLFVYYKPVVKYESLRERISEIFNQKMTNIHILLGFAAVLIATSIFLSLSRGGIVSLSLSMVIFGGGIILKGKMRKRGLTIIAIFSLVLYVVGWFGWEPIFSKFARVRDSAGDISEFRFEFWQDCLTIIKDFPFTGVGFGNLVHIYPKYRSTAAEGVLTHAHNDYLELFVDGGIVAVLLFVWFLGAVVFRSFRVFLTRHESYSIYAYVASLTGMIAILIHSITDFNLHIGANGLYFFFLAGLAVSTANTRLRGGSRSSSLKTINPPMKLLTASSLVLLLASVMFNGGVLAGNYYYSLIRGENIHARMPDDLLLRYGNISRKASFLDPLEAKYRYATAHAAWHGSQREEALRQYRKVTRLNPVNGEYLQTYGLALSKIGKNDTAAKLLQTGIENDISNPARYRVYASWLLSKGEREQGIRNMMTAVSLEPQKTKEYVALLVLYGLDDKEIRDALPDRIEPHLLFADYLRETGSEDLAAAEYLGALEYASNEKSVLPGYYYKPYAFFVKRGMHDEALLVMTKALLALPEDARIRLTAAEAYERAGILYRALEEYRQALLLDPRNEKARKKVDELR